MGWGFFCVRLTLGGREREGEIGEGKRRGSEGRKPVSLLSYTPYSPSTVVVTSPLQT
jgi:hypothetical protein